MIERSILSPDNEGDVSAIADAASFVAHTVNIYSKIQMAVEEFLDGIKDPPTFERPLETLFEDEFHLSCIEQDKAKLCFANLYNGISATPYAIIVDEAAKAVIVTVRGTRSLEDMVIDLQYIPHELDEVGKRCGFEGKGHYCHKGVLSRCKWMYNDIKK